MRNSYYVCSTFALLLAPKKNLPGLLIALPGVLASVVGLAAPTANISANTVAVQTNASPSENELSVPFQIFRVVGSSDFFTACSVEYFTIDETALAGVHYQGAKGTVMFGPGEQVKDVSIALTADDGVVGGNRTFRIVFTNAVNATIEAGNRSQSVVTIRDNEYSASNPDLTFRPAISGTFHAVQKDGKMLIRGNSCSPIGAGCSGLYRLNQDGTLDPSYQPTFEAVGSDPQGLHSSVWELRLGADDSAIIRGDFSRVNGINRPGLVRLRSDGSVDESFVPPADLPDVWNYRSIILLKDGRLLIQNDSDGSVRMLLPTGNYDRGFALAGALSVLILVIEDSEGRLLVPQSFADDVSTNGLIALKTDGARDPSFNARFNIPSHPDLFSVRTLLLQPDGKVLVAGYFITTEESDVYHEFFSRLNPDGTPDLSFSPPSEVRGRPGGIALQPDGRILVETDLRGDRRIRRLFSDGSADPSFTPIISEGAYTDSGWLPASICVLPNNTAAVANVRTLSGVPVSSPARLRLDQFPRSAVAIGSEDTVQESVTEARVIIRRLGESLTTARISFATRDDSAKGGRDYVPKTGTIEFGPLEVEKSVGIAILDNDVLDSARSFEVVLTDASGFEVTGPAARVVIYDDEVGFLPGAIQLTDTRGVPRSQPLIRWNTALSRDYKLEASSDLKSWHQVPGTPVSWGLFWEQVDPEAGTLPARFYRVREIRR